MNFTKIYKLFLPHKKLFILDFSSAFFVACLDLVFPFLTQRIIDVELPNKNYRVFTIMIAVLIGIQIFRFVFDYIVTYYGHMMGINIRQDMRNRLFRHLQKLSMSYFDNIKTGAIMSRVMGDLEIVSELAHHGPENLFIIIITFIGAFILMLSLNVLLTLIIFFILIFYIYFVIKQNSKMKVAFKKYREVYSVANSQLEDSIAGIRVVKAFGYEKNRSKKFEKNSKKVATTLIDAFKSIGLLSGATGLYAGIVQIIIVLIGGKMVMNGTLTVGILVAFLLFVNRFLAPVKMIVGFLEMYQLGVAGYNRYEEIMDIDPDIKDSKNSVELKEVRGTIDFKNIGFSYNSKNNENSENSENKILENFNLKIRAGEKIALVGPSGVGKSTICSLIPRFYDVSDGKITIDKINIKNICQKSLRKNIGIVQQDTYLFHGTVFENIAFGKLNATPDQVKNAAIKANALEFINKLPEGMNTEVGERGVKLSGGQKQRISIARIFLKDPKILILDEATSALDNQTEQYIQSALEKLTEGRTSITIAHRLSTIRKSDRIIYIDENGIQEEGTHSELEAKKGKYYKLSQFEHQGFIK